jgi:3-hydroxyisobutyrate dehydrogenase-like beta-hydroxyacid dehydrogenase
MENAPSPANESMPVVAIIGSGEMGAAVGRRLHDRGARVLTSLAGRSPASIERIRDAGLEIVDNDDALIGGSDFVLSIVPPGVATEVAARMTGPLARAVVKPLYVECNAVSPDTVKQIETMLAGTGCAFVDAGIIGGPPPVDSDRGPRFYASGESANRLTDLRRFGLDIYLLDGPVGAASALKLAYAGVTKGLIALGAATAAAAVRHGLTDALRAELTRTQPNLLAMFDRFIPTMFPKAYRWVAEMEQIAEFLGGEAEGAAIYRGAALFYERIAAELEQGGTAGSVAALKEFCGDARKPGGQRGN